MDNVVKMQTSLDNFSKTKNVAKKVFDGEDYNTALKHSFIRSYVTFIFSETEFEEYLKANGYSKDDVLEIPNTNGFFHKKHYKEFLKLFKKQ